MLFFGLVGSKLRGNWTSDELKEKIEALEARLANIEK